MTVRISTGLPLRVGFRNFWPGFDPHDFFLPLLGNVSGAEIELVASESADICVSSVMLTRNERWAQRLKHPRRRPAATPPPTRDGRSPVSIWYTGENVRPPTDGYDLTLSFDLDDYSSRNAYLPLLYLGLDWFASLRASDSLETSRVGEVLTPHEAAMPRGTDILSRTKFACAFIGNMEPRRLRAIEALSTVGDVDVFGAAVGRPVGPKASIACDYRYMLCFENDLYPGYVTEKPLEAYAVGCIPLWSGIDRGALLNPKAVVNADEFRSLTDFCGFVQAMDRDPALLQSTAAAPLLAKSPSLDAVQQALHSVLTTHGVI